MLKNIYTKQEMAATIDHTLLKPNASQTDILKICKEAKQYQFASVCVNPVWISLVANELKGTLIKPCCVISFPLGSESPEMKAIHTAHVIEQGALEVDMVLNLGAVKSQDWTLVENDIQAVISVKKDALIKVIIEACLLSDEEKTRVCHIAKQNGADFVKTSTGFSTGGATIEDVALMRKVVGPNMGVKASGGIRTLDAAQSMLAAGASRLGTSAGIEIIHLLN